MGSHYSIIKYVPDPVKEECVNIGVITVGESGQPYCKFLRTWGRATNFAGISKADMKLLVQHIEEQCSLIGFNSDETSMFSVEGLERLSHEWQNTIQLTAPRGSLRPAGELLDMISDKFLVERSVPRVHSLTKATAISIGRNALRDAVRSENIEASYKIVGRDEAAIRGESVMHHLDYGLKNGVLRLGGFGMSFDVENTDMIESQLHRIYTISNDVRQVPSNIPLAAVIVGDVSKRPEWMRTADALLGKRDVALLQQSDVESWTQENVHEIALGHYRP